MSKPTTAAEWAEAVLKQSDAAGVRVTLIESQHLRELLAERETLRTDLLAAASQRDQALSAEHTAHQVLAHFVDDEPCQFDHDGACQAHGVSGPPCRNAMARQLLGMDGRR